MIIKLSIGDNDFESTMMSFAKKIACGMYPIPTKKENKTKPGYFSELIKKNETYRNAIRKTTDDTITDEEKEMVINAIKEGWNEIHKDNSYLYDLLNVEIVDFITDKWQNGEVFYIITTAYHGNILNV